MSKKEFLPPYIGIDDKGKNSMLYDQLGNYSVILEIENPVMQYGGDVEDYYNFHFLFTNIIKILGAGNALQKQDIFVKKKFCKKPTDGDYLSEKFFEHFQGREYVEVKTYLILTGELSRSKFFGYDEKKYKAFLQNVIKIISFLKDKGIEVRQLNKKQLKNYLFRYFTFQFEGNYHLENLDVKKNQLEVGMKNVQCISLVDIEEVELPTRIKPFRNINIANRQFPVDLFNFLTEVPDVDTVIFNQTIQIPNQRNTINLLEAKKRKHKAMPDPANDLAVEDIDKVMNDIAREGQMLVNTHYDIIISGKEDLTTAFNFVESSLFDSGINVSKQAYNQYELFRASLPGNSYELKAYDKFQCTADIAVILMYKERLPIDEISNFQIYFTNRQGVPIAFDPSDLMVDIGRCNNRNKFILGPSGSGKSFFMNALLRQYALANCDIVLVDCGHSYSGLCQYIGGKYITYTEANPITMNPFKIADEEYNEEKREFFKSLIALLWKGPQGSLTQVEDTLLSRLITSYYNNFFFFKEGKKSTEEIEKILKERWNNGRYRYDFLYFIEKKMGDEKFEELRNKYAFEQSKYEEWITRVNQGEEVYRTEFLNIRRQEYIEREHMEGEKERVRSLNFNSFYEYSRTKIPQIILNAQNEGDGKPIEFNLTEYLFVLGNFYKGGDFDRILNNDLDNTLFNEQFIVFEIDSIKEHKILFPIVTLIIMDVFIQKMRIKKNRKSLIIEEAWKAIASPLMANYILYMYKTVRKFWGEAMVVTQELGDIIGNAVVKDSIIANSDTTILLDQTKFKDKYAEISDILSLNEVEQNKIFTVNNLNNKDNRGKFKEVYIKRGAWGDSFGVEVSLHEYFTFTTERREKDAVQVYINYYKSYRTALDTFIEDLKKSELSTIEFTSLINSKLFIKYQEELFDFQKAKNSLINDYVNSEENLVSFINQK